jgi:hypothetical protein
MIGFVEFNAEAKIPVGSSNVEVIESNHLIV